MIQRAQSVKGGNVFDGNMLSVGRSAGGGSRRRMCGIAPKTLLDPANRKLTCRKINFFPYWISKSLRAHMHPLHAPRRIRSTRRPPPNEEK